MMRAYADNVIIVLEQPPKETKSGLALPDRPLNKRGIRTARVISSGPGYWRNRRYSGLGATLQAFTELSGFVPNEVRANDRVVVDSFAGQDYAMDLNVPRHNKALDFGEYGGERGEFRIIRESEIICVISDDANVE